MSFVVDAGDWVLDGRDRQSFETAIEALLERVAVSAQRGERIWIGDDLQTRPLLDDRTLWQLSDSDCELGLAPEVWQEIAAWLGSAPRYLDEEVWPEGFEDQLVSIGGEGSTENADVAWVLCWRLSRKDMACIGLFRSGSYSVSSRRGQTTVSWINSDDDQRKFWIEAIERDGSVSALDRYAANAFPQIFFSSQVWLGIRALAGGYTHIASRITEVLSVLDRHGKWIFTASPPSLVASDSVSVVGGTPTNQLIERRFLAHHVDATPENPNVYSDSDCRRAREIRVGGSMLYCSWHAKLEPHRNRLYFHPPVPESGGRIVIGIFHEHLPTP